MLGPGVALNKESSNTRFVIILMGMIERKMLIQQKTGDWPQEQKSPKRGRRVSCAICMAIH